MEWEAAMQRIVTFLWFDKQAEDAAKFYVSVFKNSKILGKTHYGDHGPQPQGTVMTVEFELDGQRFTALNGGPTFHFNEAISLVVRCKSQEEIDEYWSKLTAGGGQEVECGWLRDKYGLSWQIVPADLPEWLMDDPERANAVMHEVLKMKKLDLATLKRAHDQPQTVR